jgi:hypothetical protein
LTEVNEIFDDADDQLERLRGELRRQYPALVAASQKKLASACEDIEFPSAEVAAAKFTHKLDYTPDPTSGDILLAGVSEEVAAKVRAQVEESRNHILQDAQENLLRELLAIVTGAGDTDQGILGVLGSDCRVRRSRFEKLRSRLEVAKEYNWIESERFDEAIAALEPIANADLDVVRGDTDHRRDLEATAKAAVGTVSQSILGDLGISA